LKEHWINTDSFSYPLVIGRGAIKHVGHIIREKNLIRGEKVALITSKEIFESWGGDVNDSFSGTNLDVHRIAIPDGENAKELDTLDEVYSELVDFGFHRDGLIVALGGGSVSDVAGFAASTYLRGVDYINVPTTLLAQIDSCLGGKTGINHEGGKNLIGAYWQPRGVIVDPDIIAALEPRQVLSGLAEAVKAGVIADEELFNYIEENFEGLASLSDNDALDHVIERALLIKAQVVEADEKETMGYRVQLNFGHTYGHAFEALLRLDGRPITHGQAVAIGMLAETHLAHLLGMISEIEETRIASLCRKIIDPAVVADIRWEDVLMLLNIDKKSRDDGIYFVLPRSIGTVELAGNIDESLMQKALESLASS